MINHQRPQSAEPPELMDPPSRARLSGLNLFDCARTGKSIVNFRHLITRDTDIYHTDDCKRSILMYAAQNYHRELWRYLLTHYPALITCIDALGRNVFHFIGM